MNLSERIETFSQLQLFLDDFLNEKHLKNENLVAPLRYYTDFEATIQKAINQNAWFNRETILFSLQQWRDVLTSNSLEEWMKPCDLQNVESKKVGLVLAGNIPLVGFHDVLATLMVGHTALVKTSSNDNELIRYLTKVLCHFNADFSEKIQFIERLENFDAVIATGSNNTARYFEYYFGKYPHIIRKNRTSVAVLQGNETEEELKGLAFDILQYFGLGCRNVTKLFVPKDYDINLIFKAVYPYSDIANVNKYVNNYEYYKAIYLLNQEAFLDNNFLIIKENEGYQSPVGVLYYEYYDDIQELKNQIIQDEEQLQCVVSKGFIPNEIPFGETQKPALSQYADNVDTVAFLCDCPILKTRYRFIRQK